MSDDTIERDDTIEPTPPPTPPGPEQPANDSPPAASSDPEEIDLTMIERDLDAVQSALGRLADGSYWSDEITGDPIPHDRLVADPLARRA